MPELCEFDQQDYTLCVTDGLYEDQCLDIATGSGNPVYSCNNTNLAGEFCCNDGCDCTSGSDVVAAPVPYTISIISESYTNTRTATAVGLLSDLSPTFSKFSSTFISTEASSTPTNSRSSYANSAPANSRSSSSTAYPTSSPSSNASASNGSSSDAVTIGVGVGVGVGGAILVVGSLFLIFWLRRRRPTTTPDTRHLPEVVTQQTAPASSHDQKHLYHPAHPDQQQAMYLRDPRAPEYPPHLRQASESNLPPPPGYMSAVSPQGFAQFSGSRGLSMDQGARHEMDGGAELVEMPSNEVKWRVGGKGGKLSSR